MWISDLRNYWRLLITVGLCKIVSGGRMVSGYSYYDSKHKIIMGIVVLLTRDPQFTKLISIVDRVANSYWIWLLIWIVLPDSDWLFGYLMNVSGIHTAGWPCVMACRSQTSWEGFPLEMGFGWNAIGHFENVSSVLHVW